jgi:nucleoside-diphosphate-sugar epimerase
MSYPHLLRATNSLSDLEDFAEAALACWKRRVPFGTYNITNPGEVTTDEVVNMIRRSGVNGKKEYSFFEDDAEFRRMAAKTPRSNCVLSSAKLAQVGISLPVVHEAIERDLRLWQKGS